MANSSNPKTTPPGTHIAIPQGLEFGALGLSRDPVTLDVSFDWAPVLAICEASGINPDFFRAGPEDRVAELVSAWYQVHRAGGGAPDAVAEQLAAEVAAESLAGGPAAVISHGGRTH